MGSRIRCFMLDPSGRQRVSLRRYAGDSKCPLPQGYHNASVAVSVESKGRLASRSATPEQMADPRWPTLCGCGYAFTAEDAWQIFNESLYTRRDTGEEMTIREAPAGAMWFADWMLVEGNPHWMRGPDGHCLMVKTPGGEWAVDGRASNCTMPEDNEHKCWVRHGVPPDVTVDKNGRTCGAGGGSIGQKTYHGFLRNGYLEEC